MALGALVMCAMWVGSLTKNAGWQKIKLYRVGRCGRQSFRFVFHVCICMSSYQFPCRCLFFLRLACNVRQLCEGADYLIQPSCGCHSSNINKILIRGTSPALSKSCLLCDSCNQSTTPSTLHTKMPVLNIL